MAASVPNQWVSLVLISQITGLEIPINTSGIIQIVGSMFLYWGTLILMNSIVNIFLYIIGEKLDYKIARHFELISRFF